MTNRQLHNGVDSGNVIPTRDMQEEIRIHVKQGDTVHTNGDGTWSWVKRKTRRRRPAA